MKILILKPSSLGDVVQALPVLRLLKRWDARNEIYWWLSADLAELLQHDPDLSGLFLFQRRHWARPSSWIQLFRSIGQMRALGFDLILDLQGLARSSLIGWLARGRLMVGVEDWREGAPGLHDRVVPRPSRLTHAVDWYLEVLRVLDVPVDWDFTWLPERAEAARRVRQQAHPELGDWIALHPGARWTNKRWPLEFYIELVRRLVQDKRALRFVILGSAADGPLGAALAAAAPGATLDLTGQTSLSEMIEWIRLSRLIVTNDTGPMHVAAALQKPVVAIFGPTEARRTGPYGQIDQALRIALPCAPCLKPVCHFHKPLECLRGVAPEAVLARVKALLP